MKREDLKIVEQGIRSALGVFGIQSVRRLKPADNNYKGTPFSCSKDTIERILKAAKGKRVNLSLDIVAEVAVACGLTVEVNGLGYDVTMPPNLEDWQLKNMKLIK